MRFRSLNAKEYYYARFHAVRAAGKLRGLQAKLKATPSLKNVHRFKCELKIAQIQADSTARDEAYWEEKFAEELRYSPDQPRVPAGHPTGGQWTSDGENNDSARAAGGGSIDDSSGENIANDDEAHVIPAQYQNSPRQYSVILEDEEAAGGHTISEHVGKNEDQLIARVNEAHIDGLTVSLVPMRNGSFPSIEAANKLVNSTLAQNQFIVDQVANGSSSGAFVTAKFSSKTGIEAYAPSPRSQPYIRDTFGVGVAIVHDNSSSKGYTVITAYPRND